MQVIKLDINEFSNNVVQSTFPSFELREVNQTLAVVIDSLECGETALLATYGGQCKVVKRISLSAYNVKKLLATQGSLIYHISDKESVVINNVLDFLEVV